MILRDLGSEREELPRKHGPQKLYDKIISLKLRDNILRQKAEISAGFAGTKGGAGRCFRPEWVEMLQIGC